MLFLSIEGPPPPLSDEYSTLKVRKEKMTISYPALFALKFESIKPKLVFSTKKQFLEYLTSVQPIPTEEEIETNCKKFEIDITSLLKQVTNMILDGFRPALEEMDEDFEDEDSKYYKNLKHFTYTINKQFSKNKSICSHIRDILIEENKENDKRKALIEMFFY